MNLSTKAELKRDLILKAAIEFILENDFNNLTLEAVAKQAGISKGGLLYHFPNKEALLAGLTQHIFEEFITLFKEKAHQDPIEKGKWSRALVELSKWDLEHNSKLNIGVLSQSLLDQDTSKAIDTTYQYVQDKIEEDVINPVTATIIRLAIDGLYYSELLNVAPIEKELREKVLNELLNMTK
ncbi:TetR/AcrR family transcriptional regulator [Priestia megaterium]|uniref:TetR/AcrR family transcriptional regulator n=1 Tax=Priestia megaterium TaxID=1404 RepID=UPI002815A1B2|nr:TetR/AcrR family transcriptional regulator [Priestia megaterium]